MNDKGVGIGLIAVAAFLFAMRFLCAATFGSGVSSWNGDLFSAMYRYVGPDLTIASGVSLIAGLFFLWRGERQGRDE